MILTLLAITTKSTKRKEGEKKKKTYQFNHERSASSITSSLIFSISSLSVCHSLYLVLEIHNHIQEAH